MHEVKLLLTDLEYEALRGIRRDRPGETDSRLVGSMLAAEWVTRTKRDEHLRELRMEWLKSRSADAKG